jgi:predicted secreted protein
MSSTGLAGRGAHLQRSPDGVTYTTLAQVKSFQQSGSKQDYDDITTMDSPSSFREYLATLNDSGEMGFDLIFLPGSSIQQQLRTDFNNQTLLYWKVVLSNGTNGVSFTAYVQSPGDLDNKVDKAVVRSGAKLKITGPVTEF